MQRAYYKNSISNFVSEEITSILGSLSYNHTNRSLDELQRNAWISQIEILKEELIGVEGYIYFEFAIPRMGKRVDNILVIKDTIFVIEFKIGDKKHHKHAEEQVIDYCLDLKNFHEGSHDANIVPILVSSEAKTLHT